MATSGLKTPMQRVRLDEDEAAVVEPMPSGAQRLRGWVGRRPGRAVAVAVAVVVVLATALVGVPRWSAGRERAEVLGEAAFPGAVRALEDAPRARWSAAVDGSVTPVLVGDVIVATAGAQGEDRRLVGLDVVGGRPLWSLALPATPVPENVLCRPLDGLLACVVGPAPPTDQQLLEPPDATGDEGAAAVLVVDPSDGTVLSRSTTPGWIVATAQAGTDLVVATYAWGMLTVRRVDPATGEARWVTQRWSTFQSASNGRVSMTAAAGLVFAAGNDVTLVLDAVTGKRLPRPAGATVADQTRLLDDGTLVRTRYRLRDAGVDAVSELSTGKGATWATVQGVLAAPAASDGTSGLVFGAGGLAAQTEGGRVRAYDRATGEAVWLADAPASEVAVDAADRVVLRGGSHLVGLEAATGSQVWALSFGPSVRRTFTDGRRVVVEHETADGTPVLTAVSLDRGTDEWDMVFPIGTSRAVRLGSHLYALGDDTLVALR
ncbi:outer membrane protein assembly factor BamB family protein [Cellulomonas sp. P5_C6]